MRKRRKEYAVLTLWANRLTKAFRLDISSFKIKSAADKMFSVKNNPQGQTVTDLEIKRYLVRIEKSLP